MRGLHGINWHLEQVTAPASEPLGLEFVRDEHLKVASGDYENFYIQSLIVTARHAAERHTRRALVAQTWAQVMDRFPCGVFELAKPPVLEVTSIEYLDEDGLTQTVDASAYQVSAPRASTAQRARVAPAIDTTWPTTGRYLDAVTVTFTCGYDVGSPIRVACPEEITHGMLLLVGELYKTRSESIHAVHNTPAYRRAESLWLPYRVY